MKTKSNKVLIIILLVLILILGAIVAGMSWFLGNHFFVDGKPYRNGTQLLDLRERDLTIAEYEAICAQVPDCEITWSVPFRNTAYPDDITSLSVTALSAEDLQVFPYFPKLKSVDATGCRDYDVLMQLKQQYPDIALTYTVEIGGTEYPHTATSVVSTDLSDEEIALFAYLPQLETVDASGCGDVARLAEVARTHSEIKLTYQVELLGQTFNQDTISATFKNPDMKELMAHLPGLTGLQQLHIVEPSCAAEDLLQLVEQNPGVAITWDKTILGQSHSSTETEFDFSGMSLSLSDVEASMKYFPNAEKVIMSECGFDNETMAAFRDKMRSEYKVVWTVYLTRKPVRTDQEVIHSSALGVCLIDEQSQDLKYCEDAIVVDIGHSYVKNIEWVQYMPNLKYLILTHNWIKDLGPISRCKNLIYLEIYWNEHIPDYSPLLGCTALKDLNLCGSYADPEPLYQMTWLENLWAGDAGLTAAEAQQLHDSLPNTNVVTKSVGYSGGGWRQVPRYFEMRDIMGLPYNTW